MATFGEHRDTSLVNNSSFGDNLESVGVSGIRSPDETFCSIETGSRQNNALQLTRLNAELKEASKEKARLSKELTDQKQEMRELKDTNAKLTEHFFGLKDRYIQSNDRLYNEMKTPTRADGKVQNLNN